jgi:photosystem II stability/assembly factor-like uncharacterized protein
MAVHFESETTGCVAGAFNRLFCTDDGGNTWTPWMDRIDNPNELHFYAIAGCAKGICLAGEQGMVWRFDAEKGRFVTRALPYQGSVFGLLAADGAIYAAAFDLRGNLFRSVDEESLGEGCDRQQAGITSGAVLSGGAILLDAPVRWFAPGRRKDIHPDETRTTDGLLRGDERSKRQSRMVGSEGVRVDCVHD